MSVAWLALCQDGLPRVGRSREQTVWSCTPLGSADQDYVLGRVLLHHGQEKEGGARVEGDTQMRRHRLPTKPRRRSTLEPSGDAIACAQEKWLSPLPPSHGSPDVGE